MREHRSALETSGATPLELRRPADLDGLDGLVLPGGESTTIGRLLVLFELLEPLRAAIRAGLPVFGSCAGMILLADRVLDGKPSQPLLGGLDVVVRRNAFGRQVDSFEDRLAVRGIAGDVPAVFIRAPWVESVGPGVEVLAELSGGTVVPRAGVGVPPAGQVTAARGGRVVAVRQGSILATSFHPELSGDPSVHALFVGMIMEVMAS